VTQTAQTARTTDRPAEDLTVEDLLLAAADRMELTERGWIEKVTTAGHANLQTHLTVRLLALGVDPETIYWGVRLTKERSGAWYVPDGVVVRVDNPVPADPERIYAGVPDLAIEILSGDPDSAAGRAERERDLREKRRAYAARGVPHYWIVDPRTRRVAWLALDRRRGAYEDRWEGPLAEAPAPWDPSTGSPLTP
jgi:Uma2 family endonuclease